MPSVAKKGPARQRQTRPEHCGQCDPTTRLREDEAGRPSRCVACHPAVAGLVLDRPTPPGEAQLDSWWASGARRVLEELASSGQPFDAGDVRARLNSEPAEPNSWGTIFRQAHKDGVIQPFGTTLSRIESRRSGLVRQWVGVHR